MSSGLSTGIEELDQLLLGGISKGSLVEIHGSTDVRMSTLCHQLVTQMSMKGLRTLWVTTIGVETFVPHLLRAMAKRFGIAPDVVLSKVFITQFWFKSELLDNIHRIKNECSEDYGLIVIDSVTEFISKVQEEEFQQLLEEMCQFARASDIICIIATVSKTTEQNEQLDYRFRMERTGMNRLRIELLDRLVPCTLDMRLGFCGLYYASSFDEVKDVEVKGEMKGMQDQREERMEVMI